MQAMMDVDVESFDLMMAVNCRAALQMSQLGERARDRDRQPASQPANQPASQPDI